MNEKHNDDNKQDRCINIGDDGYIYLPFEIQTTNTPTIVEPSIEDLKKKKIKVYESKESD